MPSYEELLIQSGISNVNVNYSPRDIARTTMMREWKNHLEMYLLRKRLNENLFGMESNISWMWKFCDPSKGEWDPKFDEFVTKKIKAYPLNMRDSVVESVINSLDRDEAESYCYNTAADSLKALRSSKKPFEQIIVQPTPRVECAFENSYIIAGNLTAEGKRADETGKPSNKKTLEIFGKMTHPLEYLDHTYKYFIESSRIKYTFDMVDSNDVYNLSKEMFNGICIPFVLYACPGSGKTRFNQVNKLFLDTDLLYLWPLMNGSPFVLTNMPHMLKYAKSSVAVIPSLKTFRRRCQSIGGYKDSWYEDMLTETKAAKCRIYSDLYISEIPILRRFLNYTP